MTLRRGPGIVALVLAGAVTACASPAGSPPAESPTAVVEPPATGDPATAPPTPAPTPSVVAPSPAPAGLIVRLDVCADVCIDPRRDEYLDDGRVVHLDLTTGRLMERRLSPAGLARVEARVADDADLLGADLTIDPVPLPGKEPPGHGTISYTFFAPTEAGGRAMVRTLTSGSLDAGYWSPDPQMTGSPPWATRSSTRRLSRVRTGGRRPRGRRTVRRRPPSSCTRARAPRRSPAPTSGRTAGPAVATRGRSGSRSLRRWTRGRSPAARS